MEMRGLTGTHSPHSHLPVLAVLILTLCLKIPHVPQDFKTSKQLGTQTPSLSDIVGNRESSRSSKDKEFNCDL